MDTQNIYGNGNPPYSLYQTDGKWGLIDGSGNKLGAVFTRGDKDCYTCVPWEVVSFNPKEGFELVAWYDPCEVWFAFTNEISEYSSEYTHFLWEKATQKLQDIKEEILRILPEKAHWLVECMLIAERNNEADLEEEDQQIEAMLNQYPAMTQPEKFNDLLAPIMRNNDISQDIQRTVWTSKVGLDYQIRDYLHLLTSDSTF